METEVSTMASGSNSALDIESRCVTCGTNIRWIPMIWECNVCQEYFLCENCHKGAQDVSEFLSAPPQVHNRDHHMSPHHIICRCDGCGSCPIYNQRWHCKVCPDFDLCEACHGGLDATDLPLEHLKEHPMIAIEVICSKMLLKIQPNFSKPMDPQWSYKVEDTTNYGFKWEMRKPMLGTLSGMDDGVICTSSTTIETNSVPFPKPKEQISSNSRNLFLKQALQANGMLDKKHKVFLSHAGVEKDFVEQLHRDLSKLHHFGSFFDKDDESLPKGELFPRRIFDAAEHCELAIVVISHEYFIRKWPMLELAAFVKAKRRRPELKILPIFYKLTVEEFKKHQKSFEENWVKMGLVSWGGMDEWKEALKVISQTNGLEYNKRMGDVGLRDSIVEAVYKQVSPELMWDDSHVQGKSQMQEMIQEVIQLSRNKSTGVLLESTVHMGLFGIGGSGKTTMCKVLRNQMMSHYLGRVCHIEFGGADLLQMRLKLLQGICQLESRFLSTIDEGQVLTLLKTHIPEHKVCLIIDNVSDNSSSIEEARTLMNLPFKEGSLIMVTSRSSIVLENFKIGKKLRIPSLTRVEAKALFSHHAGCDTSSLTKEQMMAMEGFVERCNFGVEGMDSKEYHPLALKVLGSRVGSNAGKWQSIGIDFKFCEDENNHPIFSILRLSFDALNVKYQRIFLDIALATVDDFKFYLRMAGLQRQLRYLYGEADERLGYKVVEIFQAKSLVEYYDVETKFIYVHDLYREFARMEVEKNGLQHSRRCSLFRGSKHDHALQEGRVYIHNHVVSHITKDILSCKICSEAELLSVKHCANLASVDVPGMENLKIFYIHGNCPQLTSVNLEGSVNLGYFLWAEFEGKFYPNLTSLESLEELWLYNNEPKPPSSLHGCLDFSRNSNLEVLCLSYLPLNLLNLNQAVWLKKLYLRNCQHLERFEGLEALVHLEILTLTACTSLVEFPSLANFPSLKEFRLDGARNLKVIHGFANLVALQQLIIFDCGNLEELPRIKACTKLNWLNLAGTNISDCSWISMMIDLMFVDLSGTKIRFVPDCNNLYKLSQLWLCDCEALETIGDKMGSIPPTFPQSLQKFSAENCQSLNAIPHFHQGSALEDLVLNGTCVEDVYGLMYCKQLEKLHCAKTRITSLPNQSSLMRLKVLDVHECELLTRMDNIKSLPALTELVVFGCTNLLALPDLRSSMGLMELNLSNCPLVDPNVVNLPNTSTIHMVMDEVQDYIQLDHVVDVLKCEDETSSIEDFQPIKPTYNSRRCTTFLNLVAVGGLLVWWFVHRKGKHKLISQHKLIS